AEFPWRNQMNPTTEFFEAFFEALNRGEGAAPLGPARGHVRFELTTGNQVEYWVLTIGPEGIDARPVNEAADCVIRVDKALFEEMAAGRVNSMAALLRGELIVQGDPDLLVAVQRLFPSPDPAPAMEK